MTQRPHQNLPEELVLREVLDSKIGKVYFYDHLVITEMAEGSYINYKSGFQLLRKALKIIGTKPFVIISNRIYSYSLNPNDYSHFNMIPNLKGMAIVSKRKEAREVAELEGNFLKKPYVVYNSLEVAYDWCRTILPKKLP